MFFNSFLVAVWCTCAYTPVQLHIIETCPDIFDCSSGAAIRFTCMEIPVMIFRETCRPFLATIGPRMYEFVICYEDDVWVCTGCWKRFYFPFTILHRLYCKHCEGRFHKKGTENRTHYFLSSRFIYAGNETVLQWPLKKQIRFHPGFVDEISKVIYQQIATEYRKTVVRLSVSLVKHESCSIPERG